MTTNLATAARYEQRWVALSVLLVANVMNLMDVTIVVIGLPSIQRDFRASSSALEWVVAAYVIGIALALLPFGRLGDIRGHKQVFLWGVAGFTLASALCGLAPNIGTMIAARALQGVMAGMMGPQVLAMLHVLFPPEEKGRAFSLFALSTGVASVLGSIAGGVLIAADIAGLEWRPIFLVNIPVGIFAVIAGRLLIPRIAGHPILRIDGGGLALFALAALLLVFPLVEGRTFGWPWWMLAMPVGTVLVGTAFYRWQNHRAVLQRSQLVPAALLKNPGFLIGSVMALLYFSAAPGLFFMFAVFIQTGFGLPPLPAGLIGMPFPIGLVCASLFSGRLGNHLLLSRVVIGCLLLVSGFAILRMTIVRVEAPVDVWSFLPAFLVAGIGMGVSVGPLFQSILANVAAEDAGAGAGTLQTFQQVGAALGVAAIGQIFFSSLMAGQAAGVDSHSTFITAAGDGVWYVIGVFLVVAAATPLLRQRRAKANAPVDPIVVEA